MLSAYTRMLRNEGGNWTLIGLLVALGVMGVMIYFVVIPFASPKRASQVQKDLKAAGVSTGNAKTVYGAAMNAAKGTACKSQLAQIRTAIAQYRMEDGGNKNPSSLSVLKLGSGTFTQCPESKQPYSYDPTTGTVKCTTPGHEAY
jgi:type II secretory pathway pseudopilin PulG